MISLVALARMPSLGSVLPRMKPGRPYRVDEEAGDAAVLLFRRRHGEEHDAVGEGRAGHPALAPVDDVVCARFIQHGAAGHIAGVAARHRLGQAVSADLLAAGHRPDPLALLRLSAEPQDAVAIERVVDAEDGAVAGVGFGDLDHGQNMRQRIHAGAAVCFRHLNAHQTHLAHLAHRIDGKLARFVVLGGNGSDLALSEVPHRRQQHVVLVGKRQGLADVSLR